MNRRSKETTKICELDQVKLGILYCFCQIIPPPFLKSKDIESMLTLYHMELFYPIFLIDQNAKIYQIQLHKRKNMKNMSLIIINFEGVIGEVTKLSLFDPN